MQDDFDLIIEEQDLRILKSVTSDLNCGLEFAQTYSEDLFFGDAKRLAKPVLSYLRAYKNLPTERVLIEHSRTKEDKQIISYLWQEVQKTDFDQSEFRYELDKIKNRYTVNKIQSLKDLEFGEDLEQTIRRIQTELESVKQIRSGKAATFTQKTLKSYVPEFKKVYNDKYNDKTLGRGILTGYSFLDYVKNGLLPSDMVVIGGETASGKSVFLNNLAVQMWMQKNTLDTHPSEFTKGCNVLYFSLEMPYEMCARRTFGRLADVPLYALRDSTLNRSEMESMAKATSFIEKYPFEFEIVDIPRGVTVDQIEARFLDARQRFQPDVIVVDYLGLLEDHEAQGDDWLKLGFIAGKLHELARAYNIVMLTAVQLNRISSKNPDHNEVVGMHRIGRSSLIMHNATVGIQIETRKDEHLFADFRYHIIKNRDGALGGHSLKKNFKNASLLDTEYVSDGIISTASDNDVQDISDLLAKYKWNQK